ncbi:MAG: 3-methyl-2-oxobutanoate hydroxymethyltransferase, partial [Pseudomonadota bacterium]
MTLSTLRDYKRRSEKFSSLTAYDASFAARIDSAGVDVVLVGDSLGMVIQGHGSTVPVTVDDIIYHSKAVARGLQRALLMADMPFMSYTSPAVALDNAIRLMQLGGAQMVKLEGNARQLEVVEHLATRDIPVCAHLGLRPQSVHKIGGFRVQGREVDAGQEMVD